MNIETRLIIHSPNDRRRMTRLLRKREYAVTQIRLAELRSQINKEVQSKLQWQRYTDESFSKVRLGPVTFSRTTPLTEYEYTAQWWRESEEKDRQREMELRQQAKETALRRKMIPPSNFSPS